MLKGILIAIGITIGLMIPPVVHFVSGPVAPFVGGFVGVGSWKSRPKKPLTAGVIFGGAMGILLGGTAFLVLVILLASSVLDGSVAGIALGAAIGGAGYVAALGSAGAALGINRMQSAAV